jgi:rubrerythrin
MYPEVDQLHTMGLLSAHEAEIAELYRIFAETLPDHREFFERLAGDEVGHARQITRLAQALSAGSVSVNPHRFPEPAILASIDSVHEQARQVRKTNVSLVDALSISADIESLMLERRFFEVFEGDSSELKELLNRLAAATEAHRARLLAEWEAEREGAG